MTREDTKLVACDESGNDGGNLLGGSTLVLAHASVMIESEEAAEVMARLRKSTRSQAPELKAGVLLRSPNFDHARWFLEHPSIRQNSFIYVVDKSYMLSTKAFDLCIEPVLHRQGFDIYKDLRANCGAMLLNQFAIRQFGDQWWSALERLNEMMRVKTPEEVDPILAKFRDGLFALARQAEGPLNLFLLMLMIGTCEYRANWITQLQNGHHPVSQIDPIIPAFAETIRHWVHREGVIEIVHDEAKFLTANAIAHIRMGLLHPESLSDSYATRGIELPRIQQANSLDDPRVQIADLLAGIGRAAAEQALRGEGEHELLHTVRPMISPNSLWGDPASWAEIEGSPYLTDASESTTLHMAVRVATSLWEDGDFDVRLAEISTA
jgi:hypothetical protein